jgi:PAS domain S-box-containing protein
MKSHDQVAEELKRTIEILPNIVFKCMKHGNGEIYITFNEGALAIKTGLTTKEINGKKVVEILPPFLMNSFLTYFEQAFNGDNAEFPFSYSGRDFHCFVKPSLIPVPNKPADEIVGFITDVTEQKRAVDRLQESEEQLRTLINALPDLVFLKDGKGRWLEANKKALQFFQLSDVSYKGKTDAELAKYTDFYHDALMLCIDTDEQAWLELVSSRVEEVIPTPEGVERIFDVIKAPVFYPNGERKALVVIGRDVTERRQTEEALRKADTLSVVGQLAAGVAHEIRNPLTALKGFVQLLSTKRTDENKEYFDIMLSEIDRIEEIIGEFLVLAKPQSINYQKVDIKLLLQKTIALFETQAILKNVQIFLDSTEEIPLIECEENQLKQVFINLLKNATEAMPTGGDINIKLQMLNDEHIKISFIDQGQGIHEDRIPKLGQPFYTTKEKGTGLGLMVSYKIIKDHQGSIQVSSKSDEGTCFDIILPVSNSKVSNREHVRIK